ncbi:FRG domain-containing protein [Vibrio aestuarianus]|uniref:FRG domain-containing protein n=1 Tax=Vibrio aestuarianus TaxID=28171 RepID=A0A9X4J4E4_9VIBR|nr:FRG domain-containing protein [Vibrio aestuarianus]MDE1358789.1 FRG domain-containing protein [Vibrio aestuarianus]
MKAVEYRIENISEFLDVFRKNPPELFRGQAEDWPLIPSLGRVTLSVFEGILEIEEDIISEFKKYGYPYFDGASLSYTDWILYAQHHGLPTRLLDFTSNPLKALYFAVEDSTNLNDGVVWGFDSICGYEFPDLMLDTVKFFYPIHVDPRITAQESCFACFPIGRYQLDVPSIETYDTRDTRPFDRVVIPGEFKLRIKSELSTLGIHKLSIYPGVEGVVARVKEKLEL